MSCPAVLSSGRQVRKAFRADVAAGKTLVVADYGQLELRILAHMANCRRWGTACALSTRLPEQDLHALAGSDSYGLWKQHGCSCILTS